MDIALIMLAVFFFQSRNVEAGGPRQPAMSGGFIVPTPDKPATGCSGHCGTETVVVGDDPAGQLASADQFDRIFGGSGGALSFDCAFSRASGHVPKPGCSF